MQPPQLPQLSALFPPSLPCLLHHWGCRDEPTSGLDSAAAYYVMAAVRRLAERCRTVIRHAGGGWVDGQGGRD